MYMSASITLYSHSPVLISVMQWYLLSIALSVNVVISLPDDFQPFGTEISYNTPDLQVPTIDTGLLKIYQPGSPDVPVTFLDAIPTDLEVVPAELASEGSSCLGQRDTAETEGRIDKRAMCATPSPTQKEPATRYPPSDGRGYPRPVHTPTVLDPNDADPITKPARKPRQKPPGPVPLHPSIDRVYDNPFIADLNGRTRNCASRLMTLCCWGPIIKPMTTQMDIDNCQKFTFDFIFSDGVCEDPARYVCCHSIDTSYLARFEPGDAPKTGIDCIILFPELGWFDRPDLDQNPDVTWRNTRPPF